MKGCAPTVVWVAGFIPRFFFFFKALILSETTDTVYVGCSGWVVVSILTGEI